MRFYDFPPEKKEEYIRRIKRVKKSHPDTYFPSKAARELLCAAMGIRHYRAAINMAAELGDTKLCEEIYEENQIYEKVPDIINAKYSSEKDTPLMNAVQRKRLGTAEWLLDHGAKILPNKKGMNPVFEACSSGCIPALNMFKHYGIDFNQPYVRWKWKKGLPKKHLYYPIEVAIVCKQPKAVQWLLDNGVSIDNKKEKGYPSVREILKLKPELFTLEIRQILIKEASKTPVQHQKQKPSFWQRFSFGRTKE